MAIGTLYFKEATVYRAQKALVAAKFNGLTLESRVFTDKDKNASNPTGVVPYLDLGSACIAGSHAAAKYVARARGDTALCGGSFDDECGVDHWLEFCLYDLEVPLMTWVYPCMGLMEDSPATPHAKEDVKTALKQLESTLGKSKYLLGDNLSLADIAIVCALKEGFVRVFDAEFRKPFATVTSWFEGCCALPQFKAVLGDVKLCSLAEKPQPFTGKSKGKSSPKSSPKSKPANPPTSNPNTQAQMKAVGDELCSLRQKLKGEGLSEDKINAHPDVELREKYMRLYQLSLAEESAAPPASAAKTAASPKAAAKKAASPKAKPSAPAAVAGGDVEAQIKAVGDDVRTLKDKLKGQGLSGKKLNEHPDIKALVDKLSALKAAAPAPAPAAKTKASPKKSPAKGPAVAPAAGGDTEAQIKAVGDEIRTLKDKLKGEGLSGKKVNEHADVKALVEKLSALKAAAPAAAPAAKASPKTSAKKSPKKEQEKAPAAGGDVETQVKAVGDEIRLLKEKLKGEGLSGKKVNDHAEIKALVAKLTELKAQM